MNDFLISFTGLQLAAIRLDAMAEFEICDSG